MTFQCLIISKREFPPYPFFFRIESENKINESISYSQLVNEGHWAKYSGQWPHSSSHAITGLSERAAPVSRCRDSRRIAERHCQLKHIFFGKHRSFFKLFKNFTKRHKFLRPSRRKPGYFLQVCVEDWENANATMKCYMKHSEKFTNCQFPW